MVILLYLVFILHLEGVITPFLTCQPSKQPHCERVLCCVTLIFSLYWVFTMHHGTTEVWSHLFINVNHQKNRAVNVPCVVTLIISLNWVFTMYREGVITPFLTCEPSKEPHCECALCCVTLFFSLYWFFTMHHGTTEVWSHLF